MGGASLAVSVLSGSTKDVAEEGGLASHPLLSPYQGTKNIFHGVRSSTALERRTVVTKMFDFDLQYT